LNKNQQHNVYNTRLNKQKSIENNIVVNLSKTKLTLTQTHILNKGLNFCLNETNKSKLKRVTKQEISNFIRNIHIKYIFMDETQKQEVFTGNKNWKPPITKSHQSIKALEEILDEDINKLITKNKIRNNISIKDKKALFDIRNNKNIVIKKSDKG